LSKQHNDYYPTTHVEEEPDFGLFAQPAKPSHVISEECRRESFNSPVTQSLAEGDCSKVLFALTTLGKCTQREISVYTGIKQSNVPDRLQKLETKGYWIEQVGKKLDEETKRTVTVYQLMSTEPVNKFKESR